MKAANNGFLCLMIESEACVALIIRLRQVVDYRLFGRVICTIDRDAGSRLMKRQRLLASEWSAHIAVIAMFVHLFRGLHL